MFGIHEHVFSTSFPGLFPWRSLLGGLNQIFIVVPGFLIDKLRMGWQDFFFFCILQSSYVIGLHAGVQENDQQKSKQIQVLKMDSCLPITAYSRIHDVFDVCSTMLD